MASYRCAQELAEKSLPSSVTVIFNRDIGRGDDYPDFGAMADIVVQEAEAVALIAVAGVC